MMKKYFIFLLFVWGIVIHATPIYAPSGINSLATVITFESFAVGTYTPITSNGVTITSSSSATVRAQAYTQYAGIFQGKWLGFGIISYTLTFNSLMSEVGLGIFDPNFAENQLVAKDSAGNILETISSIATGNPGGGFSTFVGFKRAISDIKTVEVIVAAGDSIGIDTIMFYAAVPEPSSYFLCSFIIALYFLWNPNRKGKNK